MGCLTPSLPVRSYPKSTGRHLGAPRCVVSARLLVAAGLATHAGRACEHRRNVLKQLEPPIQGAVGDQIKGDVGIPLEDALAARCTSDHREDDDAVSDPQA